MTLQRPLINLLAVTSTQFAQEIYERLGRGRLQAKVLYNEWYKHASLQGHDPCFDNARSLHHAIVQQLEPINLSPLQVFQEEGTVKFTQDLDGQYESESVIIPMKSGMTLCLSSQVGCRMGCRFCETGRLGLIRQLTIGEIVRQLAVAKHHFGAPIRSLVFMGMGEPMDNLDAVMAAIEIFSDPQGFNIGRRHITVSTSGHLEGLNRFMTQMNPPVNLAVSVIASDDATRTKLMPINRRWDMAQLYDAMKRYTGRHPRQIFIEYILIDGVNDNESAANNLARYLQGLDVKVNLIPYNAQSRKIYPGEPHFQSSSPEACARFAKNLQQHGLRTLLRRRKGHDIMAACGQLGNLKWRTEKALSDARLISLPRKNASN